MSSLLGALESTKRDTIQMAATLTDLRDNLSKRHRRTGLSKQEKVVQQEIAGIEQKLKVLQGRFDRVHRAIERASKRGGNGNMMQNAMEEVRELHEIQGQMDDLRKKLVELQTNLTQIADAAAKEEKETRQAQAELRRKQAKFNREFAADLNDVIGMMSGMATRRNRSRSPMSNSFGRNRSRSRSPRRGGATRRRRNCRRTRRH